MNQPADSTALQEIDTTQSVSSMLSELTAQVQQHIVEPDVSNGDNRHIDPEFAQQLATHLDEQLLGAEILQLHRRVENRIISLNLRIFNHEWKTMIANLFRNVQLGPATTKGGELTTRRTYARLIKQDVLDKLAIDIEDRLWALQEAMDAGDL